MKTNQSGTRTRPQIWAIGGGKGGTGKSFVTSSLGTLVSMGIDPAEPGFGFATTVASGLSFPLGVSLNTAETTAFVTDAGTGDLVAVARS